MKTLNYFLILIWFGIMLLLSHNSLAQVAPLSIPTYNYTPRVPDPFMNLNQTAYWNRPQPRPHRDGAGKYQLWDGSWHPSGELVFDGERLTAIDSAAAKRRFTSETVQQLIVKQDTFLVVKNLPGRQDAPSKPDFLLSCINDQGIRLLALYPLLDHPIYFLSRPHTTLQLLPTGREAFKKAMLAIVKDSPALSTKVAGGLMGREDVVQIIREYAAFCRSSSAR